MNDSYFNTPVYEGKYEPIFRFAEFGDVSNYWIALNYYINRDVYQTEKHNRGTHKLDFDLKNIDGEKIFGDIPALHLGTLKNRKYVLGGQSAEPVNDEGDLLKVRETYVYAPSETYKIRNSDIVPVWGLEDTDYATKIPIVQGGNVFRTNYFNHSIVHLADASKIKTGDFVKLEGKGLFYWQRTGYAMPISVPIETDIAFVVKKTKNYIELDHSLGFYTSPNFYVYTDWIACYIKDDQWFWNCLNGGKLPTSYDYTLRPTQVYVRKAYSTRKFEKRRMQTRETVSFSLTEPDLSNVGIFIPQFETGQTFETISRQTTPNNKVWKSMVEKGEWFIYEQPEVKFDNENGVYELRVRETPCI